MGTELTIVITFGVILGCYVLTFVSRMMGTPDADRCLIEGAIAAKGGSVLAIEGGSASGRPSLDPDRHRVTWRDAAGTIHVAAAHVSIYGSKVHFTDIDDPTTGATAAHEALLAENRRLREELDRLEMGLDDQDDE